MQESLSSHGPDALLQAARCGDEAALARVLEQLAGELLPLASALTGGSQEADELVSDTLSRVYEKLAQLRQGEALNAWARRILVRRFLDGRRWRRRRREVQLESVSIVAAPAPPAELIDLRTALASLDRASRALVVLHYWRGLTLDETAAELGIRPGTARSRLARILKTLRGSLGGDS